MSDWLACCFRYYAIPIPGLVLFGLGFALAVLLMPARHQCATSQDVVDAIHVTVPMEIKKTIDNVFSRGDRGQ